MLKKTTIFLFITAVVHIQMDMLIFSIIFFLVVPVLGPLFVYIYQNELY